MINHIKDFFRGVITGSIYKELQRDKKLRKNYNKANVFLSSNPCPELTQDEKRQIDEFWKEYGIKFPDYSWFQMYYHVTGIHDPRFIPDTISGLLCAYYNSPKKRNGWDDKNIYELLVPSNRFPDSLCHQMHGVYYDHDWHSYSMDNESLHNLSLDIWERLAGSKDMIFKISNGSFAGKGVKKIHVETPEEIEAFLRNNRTQEFVLQECIEQHHFLSQFNESSVNIFRIITFRESNRITPLSVSLRYGAEGSVTDVSYQNGEEIVNVIGISEDGKVGKEVCGFKGRRKLDINIDDSKIPNYAGLIQSAIEGHKHLFFFDLIGWDFTIDKSGNPICIEYNIMWPGSILYQYANGPFAGKLTEAFLKPLKKESFYKRIPTFLKK